jgi:hypothetical protein
VLPQCCVVRCFTRPEVSCGGTSALTTSASLPPSALSERVQGVVSAALTRLISVGGLGALSLATSYSLSRDEPASQPASQPLPSHPCTCPLHSNTTILQGFAGSDQARGQVPLAAVDHLLCGEIEHPKIASGEIVRSELKRSEIAAASLERTSCSHLALLHRATTCIAQIHGLRHEF